jgi:hypothetical protein
MIGSAAGAAGVVDQRAGVEDVKELDDVRGADDGGVEDLDDIGCEGADGGATVAVTGATVTLRGVERALSGPSTRKVASSSVCVPLDIEGSGALQSKSAVDAECVQEAPVSSDLEPSTYVA